MATEDRHTIEIDVLNKDIDGLKNELKAQQVSLKADLDLALRSIEARNEMLLREKDDRIAQLERELNERRIQIEVEHKSGDTRDVLVGITLPGRASADTSICNYLSLYQNGEMQNGANANYDEDVTQIIPQIDFKPVLTSQQHLNEANEEIIKQLKETLTEKETFIKELQNAFESLKGEFDKDLSEFQVRYLNLQNGNFGSFEFI